MWARAARPARLARPLVRHRLQFSRRYNGQSGQKTYFQPPPQPPPSQGIRILRTVLFGAICMGLGAQATVFTLGALGLVKDYEVEEKVQDMDDLVAPALNFIDPSETSRYLLAGVDSIDTCNVPYQSFRMIQQRLELSCSYAPSGTTIGHACSVPSNNPCEDVHAAGILGYFGNDSKDWTFWSIYDGHAGPRCAHVLDMFLPSVVRDDLYAKQCMDRPYQANDPHTTQVIKEAFKKLDNMMFQAALEKVPSPNLAEVIAYLAPVLSGSCALMALFDPVQGILRVANTGDSRAVLGRWDSAAGKYVAHPMSFDQTGFNKDEVDRIGREHPGEDVVDPNTGRVHGIAVSRAFGDSRWKWPNEFSKQVSEKFWGPSPRPDGLIKTPPYLTAEPEVVDIRVQTGEHPDFLIMGSDGLWDCISSENAVVCMQQWLDKYTPVSFANSSDPAYDADTLFGHPLGLEEFPPGRDEDEDTYYHEGEKSMRWQVSPRHFIVEDANAGLHLIKNAFGGKRRNLFRGIMTMKPPLSRSVRDDITVQVIFFGTNEEDLRKVRDMESKEMSRPV